jgi:hypothetical protein
MKPGLFHGAVLRAGSALLVATVIGVTELE